MDISIQVMIKFFLTSQVYLPVCFQNMPISKIANLLDHLGRLMR